MQAGCQTVSKYFGKSVIKDEIYRESLLPPPLLGKLDGSLGIVAAMVAAIASKTDGPALLMPAASPMGVYRGNEVQGQT